MVSLVLVRNVEVVPVISARKKEQLFVIVLGGESD